MSGYWSYRIAEFVSRILPGRSAYWLGLRIGDLFFRCRRDQRDAVISNLRQIFAARGVKPAEKNLTGMARKTFQYFGKYMVDFFRTARLTPAQINRLVSFEHAEYLDQALALHRGCIVVSAHFGNWEIAGAVLKSMGYDLNVVVLPERVEKLETLLEAHRKQRGFRVIELGHAARGIMRCLGNNELVGLLADRDFTNRHVTVDFFGKPAQMPEGPALLCLRTGAPILPVLLLRQEDDTFLFRFHPPIYPETGTTTENIQREICRFLEDNIAERPFQWFIFEDYWKS